MKRIYDALNAHQFRWIVTGIGIMTDIILLSYCYFLGANKDLFGRLFEEASRELASQGPLPPELQGELFNTWVAILTVILCSMAMFHALIYLLWLKQKAIGRGYIRLYTFLGIPGCLLGGLFIFSKTPLWGLFIFLCGVGFLFTLCGLKRFPKQT